MRDNLRLAPGAYRVLLSGNEIGRGELRMGKLLAMADGAGNVNLPGENVHEPAFGLPAKWISEGERDRAPGSRATPRSSRQQLRQRTWVSSWVSTRTRSSDAASCKSCSRFTAATIRSCSRSLLVIPGQISYTVLSRVLRSLLVERADQRSRPARSASLESLAEHAGETKDPDQLTEHVRARLARQLTNAHKSRDGSLYALLLTPDVEGSFRRMQAPSGGVDPSELSAIANSFETATKTLKKVDEMPVIMVAADIRRSVASFAARHLPSFTVLSYREVDPNVQIRTLAIVGSAKAAAAPAKAIPARV